MNTRYPGVSLRRWLAPALSVAFLAACDGGPEAKPDGGRRALEQRSEGRLEALRVQVDVARNRLWALHRDGVYVYEITTRRLVGRVVLPEWIIVGEPFNCAPDLALDPSGAAVVSSNARTVLWRLDPERFEVRRGELALDADRDKNVGFTGLAFADGLLFGVDGIHGSLWKIDLAAAKAENIALSSPLRGACGLVLRRGAAQAAPGPSLALCAFGETRIRRIDVSSDYKRGNVSDGPCA
ncbi:MAG: hypothetical protein E6H80_12795 [Betaproteobacteria bacterium]|nr:MAG: hypothetical protein E6H80_12795 [Betaproteobacteria bacterium]